MQPIDTNGAQIMQHASRHVSKCVLINMALAPSAQLTCNGAQGRLAISQNKHEQLSCQTRDQGGGCQGHKRLVWTFAPGLCNPLLGAAGCSTQQHEGTQASTSSGRHCNPVATREVCLVSVSPHVTHRVEPMQWLQPALQDKFLPPQRASTKSRKSPKTFNSVARNAARLVRTQHGLQ